MKNLIKIFLIILIISVTNQTNLFSQYSFVLKWGICGSNDGEFNSAYDVACDTSGFVYVSDRFNHRIQKFTSIGDYRIKWGTFGTDNGEFNSPHGISVDPEGKIEVTDLENNRVQRFSALGNYLLKFASTGAVDISVDNSGNYYVSNYSGCMVTKYDPAGNEILYWGAWGTADGMFKSPHGVAVDNSGKVYVVDQDNNRIQKFTSNGLFIKKWGVPGSGSGQFSLPIGIAIDKNNYVYVADFGNNRIQKFDTAGNYITQWGQLGSDDGKFDGPTGVAVDTNGYIYVADYNNCRVQKFQWKNLTISTSPFAGTFCRGAGINVSFTTNDYFNTSNTFIAQLSNSTGDFTNPVEIGRLLSTNSGIVQCALPSNISAGTGYRIRVIGTEPYVEGTDNGTNLNITTGPNPVFIEEATNVCEDVPGNVYSAGNYNSYQWTFTGIQGYDYVVTGGGTTSSNSSTLTWLMPGMRFAQVEVTDENGCKGVVTSSVLVKSKPLFEFNSSGTITCVNQPIEFGTTSTYPNYGWTFSGEYGVDYIIDGGASSTMSSATVTWLTPGNQSAQLEVTSETGCKNSKIINVQINPVPIPEFTYEVNDVCSGITGNVYTLSSTFTNYNWSYSGVQGTDYLIESGGSATDNSTTLTWLTPGNKFVKVNVTSEYNCENGTQSNVVVKQSPNPVFENPRTGLCLGEEWNINTTATFTSYNWIIAGSEGIDYNKISGGKLNDNYYTIRWITPGLRKVSLEVFSDNGCSKTIEIEVNVYPKPIPLIYGQLSPCRYVEELYTTLNDVGMFSYWIVSGGEIVSQNNDSLIVKWISPDQGMLKLIQTSLHGCLDSTEQIINIKTMPEVTLQNFPDACVNDSSTILTGGMPTGGVYSGYGVISGIFIPSSAGVGKHEITYTYLHNNGCLNSAKSSITVNARPLKPTVERIGNTLASSTPTGNQWYLNGNKMLGETRQFLNLNELGFYQVQVIDVNGCFSELSDMLQVDALDVSEFKVESEIEIFPNPVDEILYVKFKEELLNDCEIVLFDLLGIPQMKKIININTDRNSIDINTQLLRTGVYVLSIEMSGHCYYYKLIKH